MVAHRMTQQPPSNPGSPLVPRGFPSTPSVSDWETLEEEAMVTQAIQESLARYFKPEHDHSSTQEEHSSSSKELSSPSQGLNTKCRSQCSVGPISSRWSPIASDQQQSGNGAYPSSTDRMGPQSDPIRPEALWQNLRGRVRSRPWLRAMDSCQNRDDGWRSGGLCQLLRWPSGLLTT